MPQVERIDENEIITVGNCAAEEASVLVPAFLKRRIGLDPNTIPYALGPAGFYVKTISLSNQNLRGIQVGRSAFPDPEQ